MEPNYKIYKLLKIEMNKTKIKMNKPVYLVLSILYISKTVMYEYWYNYLKPKYGNSVELYYMDTDSFIVHMTKDSYADLAKQFEKRSDTSKYEVVRPLPIKKKKKLLD